MRFFFFLLCFFFTSFLSADYAFDFENSIDLIHGKWKESSVDLATHGKDKMVLSRCFHEGTRRNTWIPNWDVNLPDFGFQEMPRRKFTPPAGCLFDYTYDDDKRLTSVSCLRMDTQETVGCFTLSYFENGCHIASSSGDFVTYQLFSNGCLKEVTTFPHHRCSYAYIPHPLERSFLISERMQDKGPWLKFIYYDDKSRAGKIKEIDISWDEGSSYQCSYRFHYEPGLTSVIDSYEVLTKYHYNENSEIILVETFLPEESAVKPYRIQELEWQGRFLVRKTLKDSSGLIVKQERWEYSEAGNLIEESLEGVLTNKDAGMECFKKFYAYDALNRKIEEREENGLALTFSYHLDSSLVSTKYVWNRGVIEERTFFKYNEADQLIETIVDDGEEAHVRRFERVNQYNQLGLPLSVFSGVIDTTSDQEIILMHMEYAYDSKGRVIQKKTETESIEISYNDALSSQEIFSSKGSYQYTSPQKTHIIEENQEKISYFSAMGQVILEEIYADGEKLLDCRYHYDHSGRLLSKSENGGDPILYSYDSLGRKIQEELPQVLDAHDNPYSPVHHYSYDIQNHLIEPGTCYNIRGQPLQTAGNKEMHYTLNGRLAKEIDASLSYAEYTYDDFGRQIRVERPGFYHEKIYSGSLLIKESFSPGLTIVYDYDGLGRKITSFCEETKRRARFHYDIQGALLSQDEWFDEDPASFLTHSAIKEKEAPSKANIKRDYVPNSRGQTVLRKTIYHENGSFSWMTHDALNRVESLERYLPNGSCSGKTEFRYDAAGRKVKETCQAVVNCWEYDDAGHLISLIEGAGSPEEKITSYRYSISGQVEQEVKPDGVVISYGYNTEGRLISMRSSDHTIDDRFFYDTSGRLIRTEDLLHHTNSEREYDLEGRLIVEKMANGLVIENRYDLLGRRTEMILPDLTAILWQFEADKLSKIIRKDALGNPLYIHSNTHYDEQGRLAISEMIGGLGNQTFSYTDEGRLVKVASPYFKEEAALDSLNRLVGLKGEDSQGTYQQTYTYSSPECLQETGDITETYRFDTCQNLIKRGEVAYSSNSLNQIFSEEQTWQYDLSGNVIEKKEGATTWNYTYDALNRLISVKRNGSVIHEYRYDPFHRRILDEKGYAYLYDGNTEIGRFSANTLIDLRIFSHSSAIAFEIEGAVYLPLYNTLGSLAVLVAAETKKPVESHRYNAFGMTEAKNSIAPWQFAGKRTDPETGLVHFGRRDYDPGIGRFMTPDPHGFFDGMNRYAYCGNDPLNRRDCFGLEAETLEDPSTEGRFFEFFNSLKDKFLSLFSVMRGNSSLGLKQVFEYMAGDGFLLLSGYSSTEIASGHYGKGELNNKVRVSYINGILTTHQGLLSTVTALSETHGNVNIHYVYRPTNGWVHDILTSFAVCLGYVSKEAQTLAATWKLLIRDMGGVEGGGKIIHYAHSIGAIETIRALGLMTEKEQLLIHVYAFGSPSLTQENPSYQVNHFVSVRDGVSLLNLVSFIRACTGEISHVVFTGNPFGIPLIDHLFCDQAYGDIWKSMGRTFMEWYGTIS